MVIGVLAIAGLVAFLVYKGVMAAREAREARVRELRALGFEPVASPPADVAGPILALHRHGAPRYAVDHLFERRGSADRLYLLDLKSRSGEGGREGLIAVLSPRLQLPRLTLSPRLEGDGALAGLANTVLKKLAQSHGKVVDFPTHTRFERRHFVCGPDESAIRTFMTEDRLQHLAEMEHMAVEGEGGLFTVQHVEFRRRKGRADRTEVARRVQQAEELLRLFTTRW